MRLLSVVFSICLLHTAYSRDFYMGMFRKNDFLVAADELHKPRVPSRFTFAQYGRVFKCPITYFRVVDRLGTNIMPKVEILRGGLRMKYIVVRMSVYNRPISVNIYVGCENKKKVDYPKRTPPTTIGDSEETGDTDAATGDEEEGGGDTTVAGEGGADDGDAAGGDGTTAAGGGEGGEGGGGGGGGEGGEGGEPDAPAE